MKLILFLNMIIVKSGDALVHLLFSDFLLRKMIIFHNAGFQTVPFMTVPCMTISPALESDKECRFTCILH